jgi:hypothetical protein
MKKLLLAATALAVISTSAELMATPASAVTYPLLQGLHHFVGTWYSLDNDNRKFVIKQSANNIGGPILEMEAPDLHCTISPELGMDDDNHYRDFGSAAVDVASECFDEGTGSKSHGQIKLFNKEGQQYLVIAEMVTERSTMEDDGNYKKLSQPEMFVYLYRKGRLR